MPKRRSPRFPDRVVLKADVLSGAPAIKGTEIGVENILRRLAQTPSFEQLLRVQPELSLEDVQAALTYAASVIAAQYPPKTLAEQGITMKQLLAPGPTEDGIPPREYSAEQIAEFLEGDRLTDEELAIVRRFGIEPSA